MSNWKTTISGLIVILTGFGLILMNHPLEGIGAIATGIGLIAAQDAAAALKNSGK